ncbi:MAG TPA: acyl-CoA dehydrogenase family protein, partial [Pirellulales bacterium]|nr:acyl-CoA dehydrogenase family protein [Pirellulales bacterium]
VNREKQIKEAEELLGDGAERIGFAKGLYFGRHLGRKLLPYPDLTADQQTNALVEQVRDFCQSQIDPVAIDREAKIPDRVVAGLGELGVLGACLPKRCGGMELSQTSYCRVLEVLGGHCGSTALFVNAHHSIGPRALVLFGTPEQQERWLPKLAAGEWISAFALTEPEAGSDASNVQTTATPAPDGKGYLLNGQKRWITNGSLAHVLTVMARTPVPGTTESKITAFIVTPDMPGFEVVEARMPKCGVRGTATARLAFHDMFVPKENVLGQLGKGLRVALTVLDFGRVTFGASCTGAAKFCLANARRHASTRVQFGEKIGEFEMVKEKLAYMQAGVFAMEAATYQTATLIDSGADDYMLETAMLKVFSTEVLWKIVNDTIQIFGGKAYFTDEPYERLMRDARINMIGEGANDVLRAFIVGLYGMRDVGLELKGVLDAITNPFGGLGNLGRIGGFASRRISSLFAPQRVEVRSNVLEDDAAQLAKLISTFGSNVERLLRRYQEAVFDRQYQLGRIADAAIELYVSSCVLNRLDRLLRDPHVAESERATDLQVGRYYVLTAARRIRRHLADLWDNDDDETTRVANLVLR